MEDFKVYQTSGMLNFLVHEASDVRKQEQTLSGDIVSFTADAQSPMKIVVDIDSTGWTGCEVGDHQKNMFDPSVLAVTGITLGQDGYYEGTVRAWNTAFSSLFPVNGIYENNKSYNLSLLYYFSEVGSFTSGAMRFAKHAVDGTTSNFSSLIASNTTETEYSASSNNIAYISLNVSDSRANDYVLHLKNIQIEEGSTKSEYEPFAGWLLSVTFPDEAGTVTDGTLTIEYNGDVTLETGGQTYTLTSISPIETLIGDNNIWADAGPVSVTYPI